MLGKGSYGYWVFQRDFTRNNWHSSLILLLPVLCWLTHAISQTFIYLSFLLKLMENFLWTTIKLLSFSFRKKRIFIFLNFSLKTFQLEQQQQKIYKNLPLCKKSHRSNKSYDEAFSSLIWKITPWSLFGIAEWMNEWTEKVLFSSKNETFNWG